MSICSLGLDTPCRVRPVTTTVSPLHPLIRLASTSDSLTRGRCPRLYTFTGRTGSYLISKPYCR
jgi:hypothetical protein